MKQQRIASALLASLLVSGGCTYLLSRKMNAHAAPSSIPDLMYAAPARTLRSGEILKPDSVEMIAWPGSRPLRDAYEKQADVLGRAVLYPLEKGEPILDRDLAASGAGIGLAAKIPDGMRAIALRSDEVVGVAGFLNPGSHVDVLVTYRTSQSPDPMTSTVLQNAQVIAVGQRAQPDPEGKPTSFTVVTLLLTPEEAERAVLASTQGSVHFLLRNGADETKTESTPMLLSMLSGARPTPPRLKNVAARPPAVPHASSFTTQEIETVLGNASGKAEGNGQP